MLSPSWKNVFHLTDLKLCNDSVCLKDGWTVTYQYVCGVCISVVEHRKRSDLNPESRRSVDEHATALTVRGGALDRILNESRRREQLNVTLLEEDTCCVISFQISSLCLIAPSNENAVIICSPYVLSNPYDFLCYIEQLLLNLKEQFGDSAKYTTSQTIVRFFNVFGKSLLCSPRFDQKYSKNSNIVQYYYNV